MRRFVKSPWIKLMDIQELKTRTKQYRIVVHHGVAPCTQCDVKKQSLMCAKIKCNTFANGNIRCFVLKEIV